VKQFIHDGEHTAPTATVCVATAADEVELLVVVLLVLSARAELSKTVENIATTLSNIATPFPIS
jgi:hypothetical protein